MLAVVLARSLSDGSAIRCVLLFLWMTSCFHTVELLGHSQAPCYVSSSLPDDGTSRMSDNFVWWNSPGGSTGGIVCHLQMYLVLEENLWE